MLLLSVQIVDGQAQVVQQQMSMAQHDQNQQHHQTVTVVSSMPSSMAQHQVGAFFFVPYWACALTGRPRFNSEYLNNFQFSEIIFFGLRKFYLLFTLNEMNRNYI